MNPDHSNESLAASSTQRFALLSAGVFAAGALAAEEPGQAQFSADLRGFATDTNVLVVDPPNHLDGGNSSITTLELPILEQNELGQSAARSSFTVPASDGFDNNLNDQRKPPEPVTWVLLALAVAFVRPCKAFFKAYFSNVSVKV